MLLKYQGLGEAGEWYVTLFVFFYISLEAKMAYAVMTAWKHKNPIDWKNMVPEIDKMPEGTTIQWFAIDEHNHGSFANLYQ